MRVSSSWALLSDLGVQGLNLGLGQGLGSLVFGLGSWVLGLGSLVFGLLVFGLLVFWSLVLIIGLCFGLLVFGLSLTMFLSFRIQQCRRVVLVLLACSYR